MGFSVPRAVWGATLREHRELQLSDAASKATPLPPTLSFLPDMATAEEGQFLKQATGRNTRGLLRVVILCLIAGAAVSSRLFSVIRFESIIHECQSNHELQNRSIG